MVAVNLSQPFWVIGLSSHGDMKALATVVSYKDSSRTCKISTVFAAILVDGSVVAWGDAECGGDSSAVKDQLNHVQQIQASDGAFAAILCDGSVVTWGDQRLGGDSSAVQEQIQASHSAFAAIVGDGSVCYMG